MALKIRGNSQILNGSIDFAQMQDLSAGKILGRPEAASSNYDASNAAPSELSGEDIRRIAELHTDDDVAFAAQTLKGDLAIKDSNDVSKFSVASATGNTVVEGTLDSKGEFNVGNDQLTIATTGALSTNSTISAAGALDAASGTFGDATAGVYDGGLNAGASNLASATVHGALAHNGTGASTALSSAFVAITGGSISGTPISGSTGSFTTITGSSTLTIQTDKLVVDSSGDVSMAGSLTVSGDLDIMGTTTTIDTQQLVVEDPMIKLAKENNSTDSLDIGFIGHAGGNYAGLVRDASDTDKKWHLFETSENLSADDVSSVTFTSGAGYSKATLVADIDGDLTGNAGSADAWSSSRTVSFSGGDVSGSFSIDGSADVSAVDLTIGAGVVENSMLAGSIEYDKINFLDTSAALGTSDVKVPSQNAVKSYVDAAVSSGGLTNLEEGDMQMAYNNGSAIVFTKVKELIVIEEVSAAEATAAEISLASASEDQFDHLSQVYMNGQKLRMDDSSFTNGYEYYFDSSNSKIVFNTSIIEEGDDLEIRYFIVS